jgi:hypothetical protein
MGPPFWRGQPPVGRGISGTDFSPDTRQDFGKDDKFGIPHRLAFDSRGCLYVADAQNQRVQEFGL